MKKAILPTTLILVLLVISIAGCTGGLDTSSYYQPPITEYSTPNPTPTPSEIPVSGTAWSDFFGTIYNDSWARYEINGIDNFMREFTGTREVRILDVTADTLVTEQFDRVTAGGYESEIVQRTELTLPSNGEIVVSVYTMYNNDGNVTVFTCTASASSLGGQSLEELLAGVQVSEMGVEYVYIPDVGKLTCQHTLRTTVFGNAGELVANFTEERWAVTDGTLPLTGTVYSITTRDAGYGQSAVTVAQLQAFALSGAQALLTPDMLAGAVEIPCPY